MNIEDYLDDDGNIALPEGATRHVIPRNATPPRSAIRPPTAIWTTPEDRDGFAIELTWTELGARVRAVAAQIQQITSPGDRVAIVAPQGVDYVASFFAAIHAGNIAVPLFAPELPGHAERLEAVLDDAKPTVVLTTSQRRRQRWSDVAQAPAATASAGACRRRAAGFGRRDLHAGHAATPTTSPICSTRRARRVPRPASRSPTARCAPTCCR